MARGERESCYRLSGGGGVSTKWGLHKSETSIALSGKLLDFSAQSPELDPSTEKERRERNLLFNNEIYFHWKRKL